MGEAPDTVDDAIDALSETPSTEDVFLGTRAFSARRLAASAVKRVLGGGGGGGSGAAVSDASVYLSADVVGFTSGSTIPFDTAYYDPDGYFDSGSGHFVIPEGKGGVFLVGLEIICANIQEPINSLRVSISNSGAYYNIAFALEMVTGSGNGSAAVRLADGDSLNPRIFVGTVGGDPTSGTERITGEFSTTFWLLRLGDLPT